MFAASFLCYIFYMRAAAGISARGCLLLFYTIMFIRRLGTMINFFIALPSIRGAMSALALTIASISAFGISTGMFILALILLFT